MARKISFLNYKGGVGKTSLIVNVAASLVRRGKRVLLVDLDTQSNTSIWLLRLNRWNEINSTGKGALYSVFTDGARLGDLVVKDVVQDKLGQPLLPGLDLIPTTFNLVDIESEYKDDPKCPSFVLFRRQLMELEPHYDYILFDCPPNILRASQNGVFASQELMVPANPDALSLIGFTLLVEKLMLFNQRTATFRESGQGTPPAISGIIFNAIQEGMDIEVPKMRMQLRMNQFKKQKRTAPGAKIFNTVIRRASVVQRAVTLGMPVVNVAAQGGSEETDAVVQDYLGVADELIRHKPFGMEDDHF